MRCKGYSSKSLLYKPEGFEEGAVDNDALCVLYLQEGLAQPVDPGNLEQLPQVVHRQTDNQVGDDHGDEDEEHDEDDLSYDIAVGRAGRVDRVPGEILIEVQLTNHHHQHLDEAGDGAFKNLRLGQEHAEAHGKGDQRGEIDAEELDRLSNYLCGHVGVDADAGKAANEQRHLNPAQENGRRPKEGLRRLTATYVGAEGDCH